MCLLSPVLHLVGLTFPDKAAWERCTCWGCPEACVCFQVHSPLRDLRPYLQQHRELRAAQTHPHGWVLLRAAGPRAELGRQAWCTARLSAPPPSALSSLRLPPSSHCFPSPQTLPAPSALRVLGTPSLPKSPREGAQEVERRGGCGHVLQL